MTVSVVSSGGVANTASAQEDSAAKGSSQNILLQSDGLKAAEDKLIKKLQEQIVKVNENTRLDEETKKAKIAELKNQISEIQERQRQREIEALTKKNEEPKKPQSKYTEEEAATLEISKHSKNILENAKSLDDLKQMETTRTNLKNSASVLRSEINLDSGRGVDTSQKWAQVYRMESGFKKIEEDMGEKIFETNDRIYDQAEEENYADLEKQKEQKEQNEQKD